MGKVTARLCGLPVSPFVSRLACFHRLPAATRRASVARRASVWLSTTNHPRPGRGERMSILIDRRSHQHQRVHRVRRCEVRPAPLPVCKKPPNCATTRDYGLDLPRGTRLPHAVGGTPAKQLARLLNKSRLPLIYSTTIACPVVAAPTHTVGWSTAPASRGVCGRLIFKNTCRQWYNWMG